MIGPFLSLVGLTGVVLGWSTVPGDRTILGHLAGRFKSIRRSTWTDCSDE